MKKIVIIIIFLNLSCSRVKDKSYQFKSIKCNPEEMPKFDGNKVSILDNEGNALKDTIIGGIEKRRIVFKPCREMIYKAEFKSEKEELITRSRIKMMANGKRWRFQPEKQDEISIQYEFDQKDIDKNKQHQLNKGLDLNMWTGEVKEGIIENVEQVWMHPFRFNQFNFTEVAPFPEVNFPLKIGNRWTARLHIQEGWGDWEDTHKYSEYEIVDRETIKTDLGIIKNCWKVKSIAKFKLGESKFDYWFNEDLGFVKMNYKNYGNQTLEIELIEVNEN